MRRTSAFDARRKVLLGKMTAVEAELRLVELGFDSDEARWLARSWALQSTRGRD